MSIDRKTVLKVDDLARLELNEEEIPRLTEQWPPSSLSWSGSTSWIPPGSTRRPRLGLAIAPVPTSSSPHRQRRKKSSRSLPTGRKTASASGVLE